MEPWSEADKRELIENIKRALSGRLEGALTGVSSALFGVAIIKTGHVPFVTQPPLSMWDLLAPATFFGIVSVFLYLYRTRPYKNKVEQLMGEYE